MKTWKSNVFGDNRVNFYGWITVGVFLIVSSLWLAFRSIALGAVTSPICALLLAIWLLLLGHFGLALQNYHSRVARSLESEDAAKRSERI